MSWHWPPCRLAVKFNWECAGLAGRRHSGRDKHWTPNAEQHPSPRPHRALQPKINPTASTVIVNPPCTPMLPTPQHHHFLFACNHYCPITFLSLSAAGRAHPF